MYSYLDFAENDYSFFRATYDAGIKGSALASIGQEICEKYLKHIVLEYANPEIPEEEYEKEKILETCSLTDLMKYISETMGIKIPEETKSAITAIDGFSFLTRYPGKDSFHPTAKHIDQASAAIEAARSFTLRICGEMET